MQKNIVLIDSHPLVYYGMLPLCQNRGYNLIDACSKSTDVYQTLIQENPDYVIIDMHRMDMKCAEIARMIQAMEFMSRTIVLSQYDNLYYQNECMSMGINAYIPKTQEPETIFLAINAIDNGLTYYPALKRKKTFIDIDKFDKYITGSLTTREQEVLQKLSSGMSNKEISIELKRSSKTISTHKQRMLDKLGAKSLIEAIDIARKHEII